ncbi:DUF3152 domain-containing protein [Streptomyces sp. JB150]|uniref:DUF3152 domain-containing protein n=1 Tax=Streptomyces sp. JB150 TaxID=2714844 RepID=UPI003211EF5B
MPRFPDGTPAHGTPRRSGGTPARGVPHVRGGHPEQREAGGGWGETAGPGAHDAGIPPQRPSTGQAGQAGKARRASRAGAAGSAPGATGGRPRQDYLDAFAADEAADDVFTRRTHRTHAAGPAEPAERTDGAEPYASTARRDGTGGTPPTDASARGRGGKGRAFAGVAAAAVTTVLAVVVAGQVADGQEGGAVRSQAGAGGARADHDSASRGDGRPTPSGTPTPVPLTYEQRMARKYPLSPSLEGSGKFEAIPGIDKAPGRGEKYTYRVDVEEGLGLDGELFAQAVQRTLNDDRSWAHNGGRTFERVHSGEVDFVITLASPGTTADWCARSGLDTTIDNVSCDSAATERVMINAYRWAQGSPTYGDEIHAYRQMLINHEVGHRLGYSHVTCDKDGDLAPVMQQQTKFLEHDGIRCEPNPWPYPRS